MNNKKIIEFVMIVIVLIGVAISGYIGGYQKGNTSIKGLTMISKWECIPQPFCEKIIDKWCSYKDWEAIDKYGESGYFDSDCLNWKLEKQFKQFWDKQKLNK